MSFLNAGRADPLTQPTKRLTARRSEINCWHCPTKGAALTAAHETTRPISPRPELTAEKCQATWQASDRCLMGRSIAKETNLDVGTAVTNRHEVKEFSNDFFDEDEGYF